MAARPATRDDVRDRPAEDYLDEHEVDAEHVLISGRTTTRSEVYHLPASADRDDEETWCSNQPSVVWDRDPDDDEVEGRRVCVLCADLLTQPGGDWSAQRLIATADPEELGLSPEGERRGQPGGGA